MDGNSGVSTGRSKRFSSLPVLLAFMLIGLVFSPSARAETEVLLAGALESISDANVMPGLYGLQRRAQDLANIIKEGRISAALGGPVSLSATGGLNQRTVTAQLGTARLAHGEQLTLDFAGDGLIRFAADAAVVQKASGPDGRPFASPGRQGIAPVGGQVTLTAEAVNDLLRKVVNNRGIAVARSLVKHRGVARLIDGDEKPEVLTATGPVLPTGQIQGATADQSVGLIETSTVGNSAASAARIWPDRGWLELKAASAL